MFFPSLETVRAMQYLAECKCSYALAREGSPNVQWFPCQGKAEEAAEEATKIHGGVWKVLKVVAETSQTVTLKEHANG